jgi:serine/threonine-protein kinase
MAVVYLAHDRKHDRPVALKLLRSDLAATLGSDRFLQEIRLVARLQHPHILPVFDSGQAGGMLWYTMPYVDGESLRERLVRERCLPVGEAVRVACEVAVALDYAHRHGVVHRDIKPENIMLADEQALVADFGVARAFQAGDGADPAETGLSIGTPAYMSPEQATGGVIDGRSDIYSLGCVLFEMLAGEPMFAGSSQRGIIARRFVAPVRSVRRARPCVPVAVERTLARAVASVPAERFTTAGDFAKALALASSEMEGCGHTREMPVVRAARRRQRGYSVTLIVMVLLALGMLWSRL